MTISEETLMAFADGELDAAARAAVEVALREDPALARRVERHRMLRDRLQDAFADELAEPIPQRLLAVVHSRPEAKSSNVVDLHEARVAGARPAALRTPIMRGEAPQGVRLASWWQIGSIAAGVLLGLGVGYGLWQGRAPIVSTASGALLANGALAGALSKELTAEQSPTTAVHIGISYLATSGDYCRSFTLAAAATSGVACKDQQQWKIQALMPGATERGRDYRTAATAVPPLILKLIQEQIQGEPLDAAGEALARGHAWQSVK